MIHVINIKRFCVDFLTKRFWNDPWTRN